MKNYKIDRDGKYYSVINEDCTRYSDETNIVHRVIGTKEDALNDIRIQVGLVNKKIKELEETKKSLMSDIMDVVFIG